MKVFDDIKKTLAYARRNGPAAAINAARERIALDRVPYTYEGVPEEELRAQKAAFSRRVMEAKGERLLRFSVVVPLYDTPKPFLAAMIASVKEQSYGEWELICADATPKERTLRYAVEQFSRDARVMYLPLKRNGGISENTNAAIDKASGEYIILLDHDDVLAPDALYELEKAIAFDKEERDASSLPYLVYSDEDKFTDDEAGVRRYFQPHRKPDFDGMRLFSNNYICHLACVRADIARRLRLRAEFDGAQDHDLFLRIAAQAGKEAPEKIVHIPKVLYHWRVHASSTASDPANKDYAYDAGRRAVADALAVRFSGSDITVQVTELPHRGFFRVAFEGSIFDALPDVGAVGGKVLDRNGTLTGGKMTADGKVFYEGLPKGHSGGYEHPAALVQEAPALDLRCIRVRPEFAALYETYAAGTPEDIKTRSLAFSRELRARGFRLLWDPLCEATAVAPVRREKEKTADDTDADG